MPERPNGGITTLRHRSSVHDKRTGQIYYKPVPPPMRRVLKGGWAHRDLPADAGEPRDKPE